MEERELKKVLSGTKIKANNDLKVRIKHQIEAEKELMPAQRVRTSKVTNSHLSVLGAMYLFLFLLTGFFYVKTEGDILQSKSFILSALLLSSLFSIYWLITVYDDYKKLKSDTN